MTISYREVLEYAYRETRPQLDRGKVADYIPALARVDGNRFGIALATIDGQAEHVGDAAEPFSVQSISKVFVLAMVFQELGEQLWQRVGREPSGTAFNSLVQLEYESGIPRNPFINAGALVLADCLVSLYQEPRNELLKFVRYLAGNESIDFQHEVAASERDAGFRNAALVNFIKSFGNIHNDVDAVLDVYFHQCSLMMSCVDVAQAFLCFANGGIRPGDGREIVAPRRAKRINALMQTCGFYDESGEFAFSVGLPGKSGVGGGIAAVIPGSLALCVWSPRLNRHGNSVAGMKALELFTTKSGVSIF